MDFLILPKSVALKKKMEKKKVSIDSLAMDYLDNPK
jgi:hypothetical protein